MNDYKTMDNIVKISIYPCEGTGHVYFTFKCFEEALDFLNIALSHMHNGSVNISIINRSEVDE